MFKRRASKVSYLILVLLLTTSCASLSSLNIFRRGSSGAELKAAQSASHRLILDRDDAATRGVSLCTRQQLTDVKCAQLTVATEESRVASQNVVDLIRAWVITGAKPKHFDEFAATQAASVERLAAILPPKEEAKP